MPGFTSAASTKTRLFAFNMDVRCGLHQGDYIDNYISFTALGFFFAFKR